MSTPMTAYTASMTGAFVAKCPRCGTVCAYWDDDDLAYDVPGYPEGYGVLLCFCDGEDE